VTPPSFDPAFAAALVRMAEHVAAQFNHRPPSEAAESVAAHLRQFWTDDMLTELASALVEDRQQAHAAVGRAVQLLMGPI
jgi:hypothetical protein